MLQGRASVDEFVGPIHGTLLAETSKEISGSNVQHSLNERSIRNTNKGTVGRSPRRWKTRSSRTSALLGALCISLVLLLHRGLFRTGEVLQPALQGRIYVEEDALKSLNEAVGGGVSEQEDASMRTPISDYHVEETRMRLYNVKKILPSAAWLASAVGSNEAQRLLKTVQENVNPGREAEEDAKGKDTIQTRLDCALEALRRLHRTAIHEGEMLVRTGINTLAVPFLVPYEKQEGLYILLQGGEGGPVSAFLQYLRSLERNISHISQRLDDLHIGLSRERQFKDESDGELLVSLAKKIEMIRSLNLRKARTTGRAEELVVGAINGVKLVLLQALEEATWKVQGSLEVAQAHTALMLSYQSSSAHNDNQSASQADDRDRLNALMSRLKDIQTLQKKIGKELDDLRWSVSTDAAIAAYGRATELTEASSALLAHCWTLAQGLCIGTNLGDDESAVLLSTAERLWLRAKAKLTSISKVLFILQERCSATLSGNSAAAGRQHLNRLTTVRLVEAGYAIAKEASKQARRAKAFKRPLEESHEALESLRLAEDSIGKLVVLNKEALLLLLASNLQSLLEEDIEDCVRNVLYLCSSKSSMAGQDERLLNELERRFKESLKAVKEAKTFKEAAEAAAVMRVHAGAVEDFLLEARKMRT